MARKAIPIASKRRQQQLDQAATSSTSSKPRIKRKNLLHGCKLCPERNFHVSAKSKVRPANPSVEGHVEKEHYGMDYMNLTKRWGYRIHYEDGSIESVPFVESDIEEKDAKHEGASCPQAENYGFDQSTSNLSGIKPTVDNGHGESFSDLGSKLQAFLSTAVSQNNSSDSSEANSGIGQPDHANAYQGINAPSRYLDLPVLDLGQAESEIGNVLGPQSSVDPACANDSDNAFDPIHVNNLSPFDPNDPFSASARTPIDPRLTYQEELTHDSSSADHAQTQPQPMTQMAESDRMLSNQCAWLPDRTRVVEDESASQIPVGQYQDQMDSQASSLHTSRHDIVNSDTLRKLLMNRVHLQHDPNPSLTGYLAYSRAFDLPKTSDDEQGQLLNPTSEQGSPHGKPQTDTSSPGSFQDTNGTPHQSPSPFKIPAVPASASRPASKRSRSSQSLATQHGLTKQPKTPTPSPPKRKMSDPHPQTPTPKSRRFNYNQPIPTTTPQISITPQPQACITPVLHHSLFVEPEPSVIPLQYHSTGPLVFPQVSFSELHSLDRAALTGQYGQPVANLARLAFFGNDAVHPTHSRTREKQMMDMVGYLRLQREFSYGHGGGNGTEYPNSGMGTGV